MDPARLRSLPAFQGGSSDTFHHPPLDGSLTIPELYAYHAKHSPLHPLFVYADEHGGMQSILYPEAFRAACRAASIVAQQVAFPKQDGTATPPIIGILAVADTISCFTLMLGIMFLGCTPFPISTRNSAAGVAHLIKTTSARHIFVSSDPAMQRLMYQALENLEESGSLLKVPVTHSHMPLFQQLYNDDESWKSVCLKKMNMDSPVLILHSSGSTAFPKPIKMTNTIFLQWGLLPYYGDVDICGLTIAAHALPMFHAMGATGITWSPCSGSIVACFRPSSPPIIPSPDALLKAIIESRSRIAYCVPAFVESWAQDPENISLLRNLVAVVYAGAPLNMNVGNALSKAGVTLIPFYGSTEVGCFNLFLAKDPSKEDWQYFELGRNLKIHRVPHQGVDGVFEPVVIANSVNTPNVLNTEVDGQPAYATSDLLEVHPTKPHLVRVYGRVDDQLMLSTGEKTNPTPLETILCQDSNVTTAIMFGRGRFQNGVLIQPRVEFNPRDETRLVEFRNQIWPSVEKLNAFAPTHSRLFKEMIIVTNPSKPLEYTPKGTPRRQVCLASYTAEIDALYAAIEESSQKNIQPPREWTPESTLLFVRQVVGSVMVAPITDAEDVFQAGCDSLQATWIRNTVLHAMRISSKASVFGIPQNFVYSHPTIHSLSEFVHSVCSGTTQNHFNDALVADRAREMCQLVNKYTSDTGNCSPAKLDHRLRATLLTGSTGRFGSYILAKLLEREDVETVYILVRGLPGDPMGRQRESFERWGLDVSLLDSPKVICFAGDLTRKALGLEPKQYAEIVDHITSVIHNAWQVDFNMRLSSFEPLLVATRNLIALGVAARQGAGAHLAFVSSISVLRGCSPRHTAVESFDLAPEAAVGSGYSESKWVAEQLISKSGLSSSVVRVGQLSGDDNTGSWNAKEWVPGLVATSQMLNRIPTRDELVSWLPVNVAATALLELVEARPSAPAVFHLVSPNPIPWNAIFEPMAQTLRLPLVPYEEWITCLEAESTRQNSGDQDDRHHAAFSLLEFFKGDYFGAEHATAPGQAPQWSSTLQGLPPLSSDAILRYVQYWQKIGHIKSGP